MKIKKLVSLSLMTTLFLISVLSAHADVRSKNKNDLHFVKVTNVTSSTVRFEICKVSDESDCKRLGLRDYALSELKILRTSLRRNVGTLTVRNIVYAQIVFMVTYVAVYTTVEKLMPLHGMFQSVKGFSLWLTALGIGSVVFTENSQSPVYAYQQANQLKADIILDQDESTSVNIFNYAKALDKVLKKLN